MDEFHTPVARRGRPLEEPQRPARRARHRHARRRRSSSTRRSRTGPWIPLTAREFDAEVVAVAKGLVARGVQPGDRVGIMSRTRYEWSLLDWAVWAAGAVPVPLYETSSAEQVLWILTDADVSLLVVETAAHAAVVDEVRADAPAPARGAASSTTARSTRSSPAAPSVGRRRDRPPPRARASLDRRRDDHLHVGHHRPAQGRRAHARQLLRADGERGRRPRTRSFGEPGARTLLFMPLAHVFARFIEVLCIPAGAVLGHSPSTVTLHRGPRLVPADVHPRGAPRVREGLQLGRAEGRRGRQGLDLPAGRQDLDRLLARARQPARPEPVAAPPAQGRGRPGAAQAAQRAGRSGALGRLGRRAARRAPRPLLPRPRPERARGLRPDRDDRARDGQPARPRHQDRHRRPPPAGQRRPDRRRRRDRAPGHPGVPRLPQQRRGDRGGRARRLVPHRRPRVARRRRLPADHRAQEGDHRHGRRQERRARGARGPHPRAPAGQPGGRRRRPAPVHRRAHHARPRGRARAGSPRTASRR